MSQRPFLQLAYSIDPTIQGATKKASAIEDHYTHSEHRDLRPNIACLAIN
jgi:hypothetical protein